jgi:hypothetical protein
VLVHNTHLLSLSLSCKHKGERYRCWSVLRKPALHKLRISPEPYLSSKILKIQQHQSKGKGLARTRPLEQSLHTHRKRVSLFCAPALNYRDERDRARWGQRVRAGRNDFLFSWISHARGWDGGENAAQRGRNEKKKKNGVFSLGQKKGSSGIERIPSTAVYTMSVCISIVRERRNMELGWYFCYHHSAGDILAPESGDCALICISNSDRAAIHVFVSLLVTPGLSF